MVAVSLEDNSTLCVELPSYLVDGTVSLNVDGRDFCACIIALPSSLNMVSLLSSGILCRLVPVLTLRWIWERISSVLLLTHKILILTMEQQSNIDFGRAL